MAKSRKKTASAKADPAKVAESNTDVQKIQRIKDYVLVALGKPKDLWRVDVILYSDHCGRINVWRTIEVSSETKGAFSTKSTFVERAVITDSFYFWLAPAGTIKATNPPIKRRYSPVSSKETND